MESLPQGSQESFSCWCTRLKDKFLYWYTTLELELLMLAFVCSLRIGDFDLYVYTLTKLIPWFFSLNHIHYSRWMSVHVRDRSSLDTTHPDVAQEFRNGKFVLAKSQQKFSLIAIDHGHEQNNWVMKGEGGIIGLTQDADALLRWAVAGPESICVISEFEASIVGKRESTSQINHHEQTNATRGYFPNNLIHW